MSQVPASKRKPTEDGYFVEANKLRNTIVEFLTKDFNRDKEFFPDGSVNLEYYIIARIRNAVYDNCRNMIDNLTHAKTIRINSFREYQERRIYFTKAIGDLESIIQEFQFSIKVLKIKPSKYEKLINNIVNVENMIKSKRKQDNKHLPKIKDQIYSYR